MSSAESTLNVGVYFKNFPHFLAISKSGGVYSTTKNKWDFKVVCASLIIMRGLLKILFNFSSTIVTKFCPVTKFGPVAKYSVVSKCRIVSVRVSYKTGRVGKRFGAVKYTVFHKSK